MHGFFRKQGCEGIQEQLSAYIDGQVTSSEKASMEKHLASCKPCRGELTSLRATKSVLSLMPSVAIPRSFHIVSYRPVRRPVPFGILRLATAATAFLLALVWTGDYWNVYPKAPLSTPPPVTTAALAPVATPEPAPVPEGTPGGVGRMRVLPGPETTPATPEPAPAAPESPVAGDGTAAPAPATAGETAGPSPESIAPGVPEYAWPIKQIEYVLLGMVAVLAVSWIIASQWAYARNKRN